MDWKIYKSKIQLKPHPNADSLDVIKAGDYQFVSKKGTYTDGDYAIVIPEKSVLPDSIKPFFIDYLKGPEKNRVGNIRLRGEFSEGILLSAEKIKEIANLDMDSIKDDEDISEKLGITKYEPPIPSDMTGILARLENRPQIYDSNQFASNYDEFEEGELVCITEKLHGASCYVLYYPDGHFEITTKNQAKKDLRIQESEGNKYWQALNNNKKAFEEYAKAYINDSVECVQFACELIPCQGGFTYGQDKPTLRIFGFASKYKETSWIRSQFLTLELSDILDNLTVPFFGEFAFSKNDIQKYISLAEGKETVSGKELHIKEGVVIAPAIPRKGKDGGWVSMKILNSKYKNTGEELS